MPKSSVAEERVEGASANTWTTLEEHVAAGVSSKMDAAESWSTDSEALRRALDEGVLKGLEHALQRQVERWADEVIGAGRYEHSGVRRTYRSGVREHAVAFPPLTLLAGAWCLRMSIYAQSPEATPGASVFTWSITTAEPLRTGRTRSRC